MGSSVKLDTTIITREMSLSSPVDLPLVAPQLGIIVKVLVTSFTVKLRVHGVFLVVVAVVEGDAREVELAICAVGFFRYHAVHALVVPVQCSGVYEEFVAERAPAVNVLSVGFVEMPTVCCLSWLRAGSVI